MTTIHYYLSIVLRRLPLALIVAGLISGFAITAAMTLPPAYVSQTRLVVESSQIPGDLAESTVQLPPEEQLQLFETRLLTRNNLLDIAKRLNVLDGQEDMNPDEIVDAMRARTKIKSSSGRNKATLMTMTFEASQAQKAAAVLNEYLTMILQEDAQFRSDRASQTQDFFQQEVTRLGAELDIQSTKILKFKSENADALPENQNYLRSQQSSLQERQLQLDREITNLREQRLRLEQMYKATGRLDTTTRDLRSTEEVKLEELKEDLAEARLVFSEQHPTVKLLIARISQLEDTLRAKQDTPSAEDGSGTAEEVDPARAMFDLQVDEIDTRMALLEEQKTAITAELEKIIDGLSRTPANAIALAALQRDYDNVQGQYNDAVARLAKASTGERIETLSRGQRVTVIEQPAVPSQPTKPNRLLLSAMGVAAGLGAGGALIFLLELLNTSVRRPEDLVNKLGITPIVTIPYLRTRKQKAMRRMRLIMAILLVCALIPAMLYAVHTYYKPLDLIADRIMDKVGFRG